MKPRIVRESGEKNGAFHVDFYGRVGVFFYWPEDKGCPTPEQVMAACERASVELVGVPDKRAGEWWVPFNRAPVTRSWMRLTPEFIGEPKRCATCECGLAYPDLYRVCPECGKVLSDRRYYTQRKGERRGSDRDRGDDRRGHINTWFRPERPDRRTGEDRRKS